jgi:hypothetical protein
MYTPRYGMHYVAQQTSQARLTALRQQQELSAGRSRGATLPPILEDEAGALSRMVLTVAVVFVVMFGSAIAIWAAGLA